MNTPDPTISTPEHPALPASHAESGEPIIHLEFDPIHGDNGPRLIMHHGNHYEMTDVKLDQSGSWSVSFGVNLMNNLIHAETKQRTKLFEQVINHTVELEAKLAAVTPLTQ